MDKLLPILGGVALLIILIFPFLPIGTHPRCPECGSRKIGVQKTTTGFRVTDFGGGGEGGGGSRVQMQYDVKYHCNDCRTQWTATATETQ